MSELFPSGYLSSMGVGYTDSPYTSPEFGSPLLPLYSSLEISRDHLVDQRNAAKKAGEIDVEAVEGDIIALTVQSNLVKFINNAYLRLTGEGALPFDAIDKISGYIEQEDQWLFENHEANLDRLTLELARIERGDEIPMLPDLSESDVQSAFYRSRASKDRGLKSMPITPELQMEAYRERIIGALKKERLGQQRTKFDWMSAIVIVDALRESIEITGIH